MGPVNLRADLDQRGRTTIGQTGRSVRFSTNNWKLRGIHKLNKEARERLQQAFNTVNGHFQTLFTACLVVDPHLAFVTRMILEPLWKFCLSARKILQSVIIVRWRKNSGFNRFDFRHVLTNLPRSAYWTKLTRLWMMPMLIVFARCWKKLSSNVAPRFVIITHHRLNHGADGSMAWPCPSVVYPNWYPLTCKVNSRLWKRLNNSALN